ncbi:MAG: alpha/beta fold hydrolase [Pirellulaceae bacterium]|nr:alpha/beta fold hydrolase [Pirellulaceae bacterium]
MRVELVRTVTRDGLRLDGALAEPSAATSDRARGTAAILLHGVGGNFYGSSTLEPLVPALQRLGIAALLVNTRGHDAVFSASLGVQRRRFGAAYETVDDCRHDLAAWIQHLAVRGHQRIALIGHSLGAIKAVYAQASEKSPLVATVVAISGPRLSYAAYVNAPESAVFFESFDTARRMVEAGQGEELFTSKFPFPLLITAAGFIDKYGPAERYNLLRFAAELPCPALFTYGGKELAHGGIPFAGLPEALLALPNADRRQVEIIDGADHFYTGTGAELVACVSRWLAAFAG